MAPEFKRYENEPLDDFGQRFLKVFPVAAFVCNRFMVNHMRRLSSNLGMDLDTAMVWGILAHMNVTRALPHGTPPAEVMNAEGLFTGELHPVRLADLAHVSGLPRETVRRKLEKLKDAGKVERTKDGSWILRREGVTTSDVMFTIENARGLIQTAKQLEALLADDHQSR